jgi:hypothetical protein
MLTRRALPDRPIRASFSAPGAVELAALARDAVASGVEREVLLLRLSRMTSAQRRGYHGRLIEDAWHPLRRATRVQVFDLPNGDQVAVEALPAQNLARIEGVLGGMLEGQPGIATEGLLQRLRLPQQAAAVMALVESVLGLVGGAPPPAPVAEGRAPLDLIAVQSAEQALARADIEAVLRRGWACRLEPGGGAPEPCWEERRIDMAALCAAVLPDHDPGSAPELFRRLRAAADRRLLAGLTRPEVLRARRDCFLALTPEAVLSAEFLRLDTLLPAALRGRVTIAMAIEDVLANPDGFAPLQADLRGRSHRLALEVGADADPALIRVAAAGSDLLCLTWGDAAPTLGSPGAGLLADALPRDRGRMVLAGVDRPAAIAWGWEMGFRLFSGRLIERRRQLVQDM